MSGSDALTPQAAVQQRRARAADDAADSNRGLPNSLPRPPGELDRLRAVWALPQGVRFLTVVNNTYIGLLYIGTAIFFFVAAGVLALLMRTQLAVPNNDFLGHDTYNMFFTTHGTMMMFLFAVPVMEAVAIYVLPGMLGARDLPFPRLSAYAYWAYAIGGFAFFLSLFWGLAPKGGWFMYAPLTSYPYSPGINADFWLLGIGFIEISAIAGAIELVVGILRTRPPGMSLDKMPIYAWAVLVTAFTIVFAFPAVIAVSMLLEIERAFHWPFFLAEKGGDPLLWQHLFWFFGHPEVYIIFLPAAGIVSMIVPTMARQPLVAHSWVVLAIVGTGVFAFGVWVHHMFATGIPQLSLGFFSAASMAVSVPSGIQIFAWLATLGQGRPRLNVPMLFVFGFVFIFVLGGLTGVMAASIPFDWQVHDTYFVVAHFHYVLIGGMVFPMFAAFYYWAPTVSGRKLSERLGTWTFWLIFIGFNVTFFPMHFTGLLGMPRRVYTYPAGLGWDGLNMISTVGAFALALGVLVFLIDVAKNLRVAGRVNVNPWGAGTLEWLPLDNYASRSIPRVNNLYPLWANPALGDEVQQGRHYLPGPVTGGRETLVTSAVEARLQYLLQLPGPSWLPLLAAAGTAGLFLLLTFKLVWPAAAFGALGVAAVILWLWQLDPGPNHAPVDIGGGIRLPVYMTGPTSHSWWAMVVLILVDGTIFASLLFAYLFLWTVSQGAWPPEGFGLPPLAWPAIAALLWIASSACVALASRALRQDAHRSGWRVCLGLLLPLPLITAALAISVDAQWQAGIRPEAHAYGATVFALLGFQGLHVAVLAMMALYTVARSIAGRLNAVRRATFDCVMLFWHYTVAQGLFMLAVIHFFPRLVGP